MAQRGYFAAKGNVYDARADEEIAMERGNGAHAWARTGTDACSDRMGSRLTSPSVSGRPLSWKGSKALICAKHLAVKG